MGAGGRHLAEAIDVVSSLPALAEAQRRLLSVCENTAATTGDLTQVIESDAALTIAVMRGANNGAGPGIPVSGVREAVEALEAGGVRDVVAELATYDELGDPGRRSMRHECFRRHAVAVRHAAEQVGEMARLPNIDELLAAALLHDVGRLVLGELYGPERGEVANGEVPEERARRERRELGIDHTLVGAVVIRRWGLRGEVAAAVERHHAPNASGHAAAVRLADLIVHHVAGDPVGPGRISEAAAALGIDDERLTALVFEFPYTQERRRRETEPCPLSARELDALRGLAEGMVYKQIAQELSLSVSTVRTHLHNVYRKIGAVDRAQAVLLARDRGWI